MSRTPPLGQHFLADKAVLQRMVDAIAPGADDVFVEVGPGTGVLTRPLLDSGASVVAIERDRRLAARLEKQMGGTKGSLDVVCADAAKELRVPEQGSWRLVGNIPYAISSPLLSLLAKKRERLVDCTIMVQKEFAERLAASKDCRDYGRLSVSFQARFKVRMLFEVYPEAFSPPPKVDSAVVRLQPRAKVADVIDGGCFEKLVRLAFASRRKQLGNALAGIDCGLDPELAVLRAENISVDEYIRLAGCLEKNQQTRQ